MDAIVSIGAYALKMAVTLTLLYVPYIFLLRRQTLFVAARFTLLAVMLLSVIVPFVDIPALHVELPFGVVETPVVVGIKTVAPTATVMDETVAEPLFTFETLASWLSMFYIIVAMTVAAIKIFELFRINANIKSGTLWTDKRENYTIYCHADGTAPYSWMRKVVISAADYNSCSEEILLHEEAHVLRGHSWDMLLLAAVEALQWFNPFVHLLSRDLKDVHEYEADAYVLSKNCDTKSYQMLIVKKAVDHASYTLVNSFNHSNLKKRITMMLKKKSNPWRCATALYIMPAAVLALSMFASPQNVAADNKSNDAVSETITLRKGSESIVVKQENDTVVNAAFSSLLSKNGIEHKTIDSGISVKIKSGDSAEEARYYEIKNSISTALKAYAVKSSESAPKDTIYGTVQDNQPDVQAEFPGGPTALMKFLAANIKYPEECEEKGIQGRCYVYFIIEKDGSITDIKVAKKSNQSELLDKEAMRVVSLMPKWNPARKNGEPVRTQYMIPVMFRLQ